MTRVFEALARSRFDILVVGGGIHGLFAAYDAASRGLRVALVDAGDYGGGLSANHQRTVHGGLRTLQSGDLLATRRQIRARRAWAVMAAGHIRPLPFVMGTYRRTKRSRSRLRAGLALYDLLGFDRNDDLPLPLCLPADRLLSIDDTVRAFFGIARTDLTGGAMWHDYQLTRPDRVNWLVARAAMRAGAVLVNHAEAVAPLRTAAGLAGVRVREALGGREVDVEARLTLLSAGAGLPSLYERFGLDDAAPPLVAAANLVIDRAAPAVAVAAPGRRGRMLTLVPWAGRMLVGTFQGSAVGTPTDAFPLSIDDMIADANSAFPGLDAQASDVRLVHRGWTPARVSAGLTDLLPEPQIVRHALRGVPGAISIVGVKFTTSWSVAQAAVGAATDELGAPRTPSTPDPVLPHSSPFEAHAELADRDLGLTPDVVAHLDAWYGDEGLDVRAVARARGLGARLDPESPVIEAEIAHAVMSSHARRLADATLRRTALGQTARPRPPALARAAEIMGELLDWSPDQREAEIQAVATDIRFPPE